MFQAAFVYAYTKKNLLDFYVQDQKFFEGFEEDISRMFGHGIGEMIDRVSIHVRRGDYLVAPHSSYHINLAATSYYDDAIKMFPGDKFLVFSDDIEWCRQNFVGDEFEFSEGKTEIEDMNLMAACKHNIIANSTFSWWAAWLNNNPHKIVVVPEKWAYTDKQPTAIPLSWIKLPVIV